MSDQQTKENTYWKSLNELAKNKEYKKYAEREFPEDASELTDQVSRRSFLRVMGASIALAGFASCRKPVQKILPYSQQPEDKVLGVPDFYATSMPFQDAVTGLLVTNNEGRPTKLEGNEDHPSSRGKTSIYHQAELLGMYDPDRSRSPRHNDQSTDFDAFVTFAESHFEDTGRNILFISEANSSPTYNRLKSNALDRFPNARWVTYEAFGDNNRVEGAQLAFGQRLRTVNHFDEADLVVSFDDDFMTPSEDKNSVENARRLTMGRNVRSTDDEMSRLYSIENSYTITGSYADHRLRLKTSEVEAMIYALAARLSNDLSILSGYAGHTNQLSGHEWIDVLAGELLSNRGSSIVTAGASHKPAVHATVAAINQALDNTGETVTYHRVPFQESENSQTAFAEAVSEASAGVYDSVVIIGANPVFTAPADLQFEEALANIDTKIHLSNYIDETSRLCDWHINRAHFLEAWGDGFSYTGERSIIQPQILPLFNGVSEIEFLHTIINGESGSGYDLVQETWQEYSNGNFTHYWEQVLHDGIEEGTGFESASVALQGNFVSEFEADLEISSQNDIEITLKADPTIFDGRYANNSWLQELPDPMTKITWDNVALMSPATAESIGISPERSFRSNDVPVVRISAAGETIEIAAWIQPGHADNSITLYTGYGRQNIGRVADGVGVNTYPLRTTDAMLYRNAEVEATGQKYEVACVQDHHNLEGRDMVRSASLEEYRENPEFSSFESFHGFEVPGMKEARAKGDDRGPISLFTEQYGPDHQPQWGMAIDLNACFGCGVCTIACQAENNIPVVGKREVGRRRAMHWIRTDRYFEGDRDNPKVYHQPVPCMHCELAPCEEVCPVAATVHSEDGMNQMTYNRCIGTRYCANNCPFKVRRFNFFNYTKEYLTTGDDPEVIQMAMNPEVTIRFRGVMEKCSYCVQRVNRAKINSRINTGSRKPADGTVKTACQQACPSDAISFGDLTDRESVVSQNKMNERNYVMLEEINVRPRTSYLGKLHNTNSELA
ncbi:4Fe-4S dicluster domain-containing protein [Rhodohalobacter sp. SW132]|uniref:TAT-variant-translocated molybdopterin oxidoreductase n=1 Tax=Rhodohalobacter sp. SW132 TaxID=2293433 RepID=UPI000E2833AC|nr:TAT-variant-translocated molybdopterin oxidoreductase [Rhodohalobacter sp. SW132]REL33141.1 4Fe-4S dicluster domain-containing protein [Rhodohalobacter sp. SW132]